MGSKLDMSHPIEFPISLNYLPLLQCQLMQLTLRPLANQMPLKRLILWHDLSCNRDTDKKVHTNMLFFAGSVLESVLE